MTRRLNAPAKPSIGTLAVSLSLVAVLSGLPEIPAAPSGPTLSIQEERRVKVEGGPKIRATFGRLEVPEVRSDPSSSRIELAFVRLHSRSAEPGPPVVYLEGGPGGSSTWQAEVPAALERWSKVLESSDVILLDQRGTGKSSPRLIYRWEGKPPIRAFADEQVMREGFMEISRRARAWLVEEGIDPRGYTTIEAADDVDDLRAALGEETISLLGFSYGTHLALATIRRHGSHIASAVLAGTEGPDHTWKPPLAMDVAFQRLSEMVAADEAIGERVPDLVALLDRVLARLDEEPMVIPVEDREGTVHQIPVGSWGLKYILRRDIGDASDLPVFPRLLYSIDQGDPSVLTWFVRKRAAMVLGAGINGMSMLTDGASAASPERLALIAAQEKRSRFGGVVNFPFPEAKEALQPRDVGDRFRSPLVSDVRVLFLSGTLDWNTPPYQAEEVRWGCRNASHIIVENAGHEQILTHPRVQEAVVRFLRGEDVSDVHAAWPPLRFVPLEGYDRSVTHPSVPRR